MNVIIRELEDKDLPSVAKVWRDAPDISVTDEELIRTCGKMKEDRRYATFVVERDGVVAGLVTLVTALAIGHPSGYTKVNGLGVLPKYRNRGIGRMLPEKAEEAAIRNGTRYPGLASGSAREDAHRFYEHMGYVKTSYWFRKSV